MDGDRIIIEFDGSPENDGHVRLNDFLDKLRAFQSALKQTEKLVLPEKSAIQISYEITGLSFASPYKVSIQARSTQPQDHAYGRKVLRRFATNIRTVRLGRHVPADIDPFTMEAYQRLATTNDKSTAKSMRIITDDRKIIPIDSKFQNNVMTLIGTNEQQSGSVTGLMEALNVHGNYRFDIFPAVGPAKITCFFKAKIKDEVLKAAGKYVRVDGHAIYRQRQKFPFRFNVESLFTYPDASTLPKLSELYRIAPDATDGKSPEDFVRSLRDADW